jgi:hypothetical protein
VLAYGDEALQQRPAGGRLEGRCLAFVALAGAAAAAFLHENVLAAEITPR